MFRQWENYWKAPELLLIEDKYALSGEDVKTGRVMNKLVYKTLNSSKVTT